MLAAQPRGRSQAGSLNDRKNGPSEWRHDKSNYPRKSDRRGCKNPSLRIVDASALARYRRENPEFDQFVKRAVVGNTARGQKIRYSRVRTAAVRDNNNDYYKIRAMIPEQNPHRDDIVARIFEDLLIGSLKRDEVSARVKDYIAELNKLYPTKYPKFGNSQLLSLDEVMFDDGSTTRGDTVSRGLWDRRTQAPPREDGFLSATESAPEPDRCRNEGDGHP
jgi:hypothetical protein